MALQNAPYHELIDTLWNVNTDIMYKKEDVHTELIDTLWNVNQKDEEVISHKKLRINRYIMECKFSTCRPVSSGNEN